MIAAGMTVWNTQVMVSAMTVGQARRHGSALSVTIALTVGSACSPRRHLSPPSHNAHLQIHARTTAVVMPQMVSAMMVAQAQNTLCALMVPTALTVWAVVVGWSCHRENFGSPKDSKRP